MARALGPKQRECLRAIVAGSYTWSGSARGARMLESLAARGLVERQERAGADGDARTQYVATQAGRDLVARTK
jgi:hypothetical protein